MKANESLSDSEQMGAESTRGTGELGKNLPPPQPHLQDTKQDLEWKG